MWGNYTLLSSGYRWRTCASVCVRQLAQILFFMNDPTSMTWAQTRCSLPAHRHFSDNIRFSAAHSISSCLMGRYEHFRLTPPTSCKSTIRRWVQDWAQDPITMRHTFWRVLVPVYSDKTLTTVYLIVHSASMKVELRVMSDCGSCRAESCCRQLISHPLP